MDAQTYEEWKKVGANIRRYRKERHLTQKELAAACGRSTSFIHRIETGVCFCSLDTLSNIADALHVSIRMLFIFKD